MIICVPKIQTCRLQLSIKNTRFYLVNYDFPPCSLTNFARIILQLNFFQLAYLIIFYNFPLAGNWPAPHAFPLQLPSPQVGRNRIVLRKLINSKFFLSLNWFQTQTGVWMLWKAKYICSNPQFFVIFLPQKKKRIFVNTLFSAVSHLFNKNLSR